MKSENLGPNTNPNPVKNAILLALQEEKAPKSGKYGKAVLKAFGIAGLLSALLYVCWSSHFDSSWVAACGVIWAFLTLAFVLYAFPQVRLSPRGYWSLSRVAVFFSAMTIITALQLILCPHFALTHLENDSPFRFFNHVTHFYMGLGGMKVCMFLCGLTFAGLGSLIASLPVAKQIAFSKIKYFGLFVVLALIAQVPVAILQLSSAEARYFFYWLLGCAAGIVLTGLLFRCILEKIESRS